MNSESALEAGIARLTSGQLTGTPRSSVFLEYVHIMLMWGVLWIDAHVLVPTALVCWLAVLDVYGSVLLVSFSWLLLSGSPLVFPHTDLSW